VRTLSVSNGWDDWHCCLIGNLASGVLNPFQARALVGPLAASPALERRRKQSTLRPPIRRLLAGLHQCRFTAQASAGAMKVEIASIKSHQPDTTGSNREIPADQAACRLPLLLR
jgi:hypothetical protein